MQHAVVMQRCKHPNVQLFGPEWCKTGPWSPPDETSVLNIACCVLSVCLLFLLDCLWCMYVFWFWTACAKKRQTSLSLSSLQQFHTFEHLNLKTGNVYSTSRQHSRVLGVLTTLLTGETHFPWREHAGGGKTAF